MPEAGGAISGWIDVRSVPAWEVTLQNLFAATMKDVFIKILVGIPKSVV